MFSNLVLGSLGGAFFLVGLALTALKLFALVDALVRPQRVWRAAVPQTKAFWAAILAVAVLLPGIGLLGMAALVAAIVYLVDVRPKLRAASSGRPW